MNIGHLDKQTPDGAHLNIDALYQLFPSCFTEMEDVEGKVKRAIDWGKLRELLGDNVADGEPEVYDFTWVGKRAAQREAMAPIRKTLRPCPEESVNWDTTQNLYIEGDNLEVLKLLQNSYMGKVKMIYIDPPYNTGNDFVYHDDFHRTQREEDEEAGVFNEEGERMIKNLSSNGKFHSDWCSMIYSRLIVTRSLLTEDGIIFVSIDDNEQRNLKNICDEVFGESNFLTCVTRGTGTPTGGGFDGLVNELDYILIYAKNINKATINGLEMSASDAQIYDQEDEHGRYLIRPLRRTGGEDRREDRPTMYFALKAPDGTIVYPKGPTGYDSRWICGEAKYKELEANHLIEWKKTERNNVIKWNVYQKFYLEGRYKAPGNLWTDIEGNKKATRDIRILFDTKKVFDFPKPVGVLKKAIAIASNKDSIILDFFSGSATTAHAVMQLNAEDGGNRKYVLVQWPEECDVDSEAYKAGYKNICEIGKERIRRAGKKIKEDNPGSQDLDIGFRVFKCDESNYKEVAFAPKDYSQESLDLFVDNIKDERTDLDLLFDCMLRWGITLDLPMKTETVDGCKIHCVNDGALVGCFDGRVTEKVIDAIAQMYPAKIVFRDSSFEEAAQKMNLYELFKQKLGWEEKEVRNNIRVI
ncbi:MAG: site-specific DNA-methyltransferase [Prevotella sp.]|nr:site-specific DNA-methyltransferase [Prevotella sp.]